MKYQTGDTVKIKKPQVYGRVCDTTSPAENSWTEEMNDLDGLVICLADFSVSSGWWFSHHGELWGLLEDWLQPVNEAATQDDTSAYDRAMSIL